MKNSYILSHLLISILFWACSGKIEVKEFDLEKWKEDRNGCLGYRLAELEAFRGIKNTFLGKDNQALMKTFGRPDKVELADRSQTFFIYFVEPSPACETVESKKEEPLMIIFRLNAISKVSEVTISTLEP